MGSLEAPVRIGRQDKRSFFETFLKIKYMKTFFETFCLWTGTMLVGLIFYMASSLIIALLLYLSWPIIVPAIFITGIIAPTIDFSVALVIGMLICFGQINFRK